MRTSLRQQLLLIILFTIGVFAPLSPNAWAEIYKYQDKTGKWHFTDKKPKSTVHGVQQVPYSQQISRKKTPYIEVIRNNSTIQYIAHNPYHGVVQCFFRLKNTQDRRVKITLPALTSKEIYKDEGSSAKEQEFQFRYVIGQPHSTPSTDQYLPPFSDFKPMKITQGFRGKFSHNRQPSLYAVDIAMPVSTKITAVRDGTVIVTKDDYAYAGVTSAFFLDKANFIEIMHEDGTYAIYAHLLLGSLKVREGMKVKAGQIIGLSGNTGYSTGPHLHFAIRYNAAGKTKSLPFKFIQANKKVVQPAKGLWLLPL